MTERRIGYVVSDLRRIGPTNQTLNIIRYSGAIANCVVFTLFEESSDTLIDEYYKAGIKVVCLHLSRKAILFKGVKILCEALRGEGIKFVHSYGTFPDTVSHYACRKIKIEHIITLRNFPMEEMTTRMNYFLGLCVANLVLYVLKHSKHVICCSKSIQKKMEETYHWSHLTSIQNGVDFNKFHLYDKAGVREELGASADDVIFIATGSMIPRKHIDETADAFLKAELPGNYKLWFLGDGNLLDGFKKKYAEKENITFWGKQKDVAKFLSAADVFVSSSESEGMPNAVLEAISCKLPVYLSDIPQHLEVFESLPNCGKAYELGNRDALAELFKTTADDEIAQMKKATEKLYSSNFTMENMGKLYREFYDRVIG